MSESSDFGLTSLDYWRLCDELTVVQAALLVAGCDPSEDEGYVENWTPEKKPQGYVAARTAILNALRRKAIAGEIVPEFDYDINGNRCGVRESIDLHTSRVEVASLRTWLSGRGMKSGFFFLTLAVSRIISILDIHDMRQSLQQLLVLGSQLRTRPR